MEAPLKSNEASLNGTPILTDPPKYWYYWVLFHHFDNDGTGDTSDYNASFGGIFNYTTEGWALLEQTIREFCENKNRSPETPIKSIGRERLFAKCVEGEHCSVRGKDGEHLVAVIKQPDPNGDVTDVLALPNDRSLHQVRTIRYDGDDSEPQQFPADERKQWSTVAPTIMPGDSSFDLGEGWATFVFREDLDEYFDKEWKAMKSHQTMTWMYKQKELRLVAISEKDILKRIIVSTEWTHDKVTRKWVQADIKGIISRKTSRRKTDG